MSQLFDQAVVGAGPQTVDFFTRLIQASTEYALIGLSLDGTILLWNEGARRLYGYEPEAVLGRANAASLFTPEESQSGQLELLFDAALQQGKWVGTLRHRPQNGQSVKVRVTLTPYHQGDDQPAGFLLIAQALSAKSGLIQEMLETRLAEHEQAEAGFTTQADERLAYRQALIYAQELKTEIAERRRVEAALRYQATLVDNVSDAIIATDSQFKINVWNSAAEKIYGWHADEVLGQPIVEVIPAEFVQTTAEAVTRQLSEQGYWHGELIQRRRDGTPVYILASTSQIRDKAGKLVGAVTINHNLTERKRAEEELHRHTVRNEALLEISRALAEAGLDVEAALDTVARHTAQAIGDACVITLLSDDEQWFQPVAFHHPNPDVEAIMRPMLITAPGSAATESAALLRSGQPLLVPVVPPEHVRAMIEPQYWPYLEQVGIYSLLMAPLQAQGRVIGTLGLTRDQPGRPYTLDDQTFLQELAARAALTIQNARLFEQVRQARERLQTLSTRLLEVQETERRHLARELHDEVGQVLTGLKLLLDMSARGPADKFQANLGEAQALVNELMTRVRHLSLDLRPSMLDDLGLLPALLWHFERYTALTQVQVTFEHSGLDRRFPPPVETAAYRLVQEALTNVARHAGVSQVTVRLWAAADRLQLQVQDAGRGFAPTSVLASGTSGGLSGMQERVALLGGRLVIETSPGNGVSLTVELPLVKEAV